MENLGKPPTFLEVYQPKRLHTAAQNASTPKYPPPRGPFCNPRTGNWALNSAQLNPDDEKKASTNTRT